MIEPTFTLIEQAILQILDRCSRDVSGRELRSLLRGRGFRRSAPALVFTMQRLEDKGAVVCREETKAVDGVKITDGYYRICEWV